MMFKAIITKIKKWFSYNHCYNQMEDRGIAVFGMCSGLSGGDNNSGYLQYKCIDCPCFVPVEKEGGE